MTHQRNELMKARKYLEQCEDAVTAAMHCDDDTFRRASAELRRAQIRCAALEAAAATRALGRE